MKLKYGNGEIDFNINTNNLLDIINAKKTVKAEEPRDRLKFLLKKPTIGNSLVQLIKQKEAHKILVIVNDITRPTSYHNILPPLLDEINNAGIKSNDQIIFIVATGIHRGHSEEENKKIFGENVVSAYRFINHFCDNEQLVDLGQMKSGNHLWVDPIIKQVDFIITTGVIIPHYTAGFSGGRKSILPGICGRETILKNHSKMVHTKSFIGNLVGNPVHEEMMEAAQKVGVDFNINIITDENYNIIDIVTGELEYSWQEGVKICRDIYFSPISEKADVVITSAGGYPKDINVYQSQKALENAFQAVKPGGTIILVAECKEGLGDPIFEQWIEEANSIEDIEQRIKKGFVLGGHKAYVIAKVAKDVEIILISSLSKEKTKKVFMIPLKNVNLAIEYVRKKYGNNFTAYVIPSGIVVPQYIHNS